ncbi:MAG: type II toxin-antitoxin system RelE/ParE family toxin [Pseudomonadota bacterium]
MVNYSISFARSATKELEKLDNKTIQRILAKIEALSNEPRPTNCKKLQGEENFWRIRIGNYRIIYSIYDKKHIVDIIAIRHRSEVYR